MPVTIWFSVGYFDAKVPIVYGHRVDQIRCNDEKTRKEKCILHNTTNDNIANTSFFTYLSHLLSSEMQFNNLTILRRVYVNVFFSLSVSAFQCAFQSSHCVCLSMYEYLRGSQ